MSIKNKIYITLALALPVLACGPYFPATILPGTRTFNTLPLASWHVELGKIKTKDKKNSKLKEVEKRGDLEREFKEALKYYKIENFEKVLAEYMAVRSRIENYRAELKKTEVEEEVKFPKLLVPKSLPLEFQLYLDGAVSYYEGQLSIAEKRWKELLKLSKEKRLYRTVWARYMIAEMNRGTNPEEWSKQYTLLRKDVADGFKDSQGLGIATYGNEGSHYLVRENFIEAIKSYYKHQQHGGKGAPESLMFTMWKFFEEPGEQLDMAAKDPLVREIVTRFLISTYSSSSDNNARDNWIITLEKAGVSDDYFLDQMAWMSYRNGQVKQAEKYIAKSKSNSIIRHWLLSRFAFRKGNRDKAFEHLKYLTNKLRPKDYYSYSVDEDYGYLNHEEDFYKYSRGEMAMILLGEGQFELSLKLFFHSDYYDDAAYLAERILTTEELKNFVDVNKEFLSKHEENYENLKLLLARRLTRQGDWKKALPYFDKEKAEQVVKLFDSIKKGQDNKLPEKERADHLWNAAVIARDWGMAILSTELYPDAAINWGGAFEGGQMDKARLELFKEGTIQMTEKERERIKYPPASPLKRFHYRYTASELAWKAIKLMPKNNVETAKRLIIAGSWCKARDPEYADRFYKELVRKCGKTELGKEADKRRWFPPLPKEEEK